MDPSVTIPVAALIVSLVTLVVTGIAVSQKAGVDRLNRTENQIEDLRRRLEDCERHHKDCEDERVRLMERLFRQGEVP